MTDIIFMAHSVSPYALWIRVGSSWKRPCPSGLFPRRGPRSGNKPSEHTVVLDSDGYRFASVCRQNGFETKPSRFKCSKCRLSALIHMTKTLSLSKYFWTWLEYITPILLIYIGHYIFSIYSISTVEIHSMSSKDEKNGELSGSVHVALSTEGAPYQWKMAVLTPSPRKSESKHVASFTFHVLSVGKE